MHRARSMKWFAVTAVSVLFLLVASGLTGCGEKAEEPVSTETARANFSVAESAVTSIAPDAKLLVVQTAQSASTTGTPVWSYLFGSPETDKTYLVLAAQGQPLGTSEYGTGGLTEKEWGEVPDNIDTWKIDSDAALEKAIEASGATGDPRAYVMGFQTYIPSTTTSGSKAFRWYVALDPGESGATTSTIGVDATTGETAIVE